MIFILIGSLDKKRRSYLRLFHSNMQNLYFDFAWFLTALIAAWTAS